jgi:hypothetical protein
VRDWLQLPDILSHANAVGGKCLRQYEGRARGGRAKRPRIRQEHDASVQTLRAGPIGRR